MQPQLYLLVLFMDNLPPFEDGGFWKTAPCPEEGWRHFRVGTCTGLWRDNDTAYEILAIENESPGNGHVEGVFRWFFESCKRGSRDFVIKEVMNNKFASKLINHGFSRINRRDYIFYYKEM